MIFSGKIHNFQHFSCVMTFSVKRHKSTVKRFLRLCHLSKRAIFGPFLPLIDHFSIFCGEEQRKKASYICSLCGQEKLVAFTCGDSSFPFTGRLPTPNAKKVCSPQFFIWSLNCYNIQINRFYTSSHKSTVKRFLRLCGNENKTSHNWITFYR